MEALSFKKSASILWPLFPHQNRKKKIRLLCLREMCIWSNYFFLLFFLQHFISTFSTPVTIFVNSRWIFYLWLPLNGSFICGCVLLRSFPEIFFALPWTLFFFSGSLKSELHTVSTGQGNRLGTNKRLYTLPTPSSKFSVFCKIIQFKGKGNSNPENTKRGEFWKINFTKAVSTLRFEPFDLRSVNK